MFILDNRVICLLTNVIYYYFQFIGLCDFNMSSAGRNPKDAMRNSQIPRAQKESCIPSHEGNLRFPAPKEIPVTFRSGGKQLIGILHLPLSEKSPCIIMVHGFAADKSSCRLFVRAARQFATNGFAVFRFDSRGCGDSEGFVRDYTMTAKLEDIGEAVKFVKSFEGIDSSRLGIAGISYGGAASIIFAARSRDIKCVDAWAPGTLSEGFGPAFVEEVLKRGHANFGYYGGKIYKNQIEDDLKYDMYKEVKKLKAAVQITHGTSDTMVPFVEGEKLFSNANKPKNFNAIEGADHGFSSHKKQLIASSIAWFRKWL